MKKLLSFMILMLIVSVSFAQLGGSGKGYTKAESDAKYITTSSTQTLTNKTLTSPKINENVVLTSTSTELNYVDGVTSAIQIQINGKISADYVIEKVASTYYARPSGSYTAYSGADATVVIQAVLDALTAGGLIHIKKGLYDNLDSLEVNNANITIEGEGQFATILKLKNGFDTGKTFASFPKFIAIAAHKITIRNLGLEGNSANQTYQWAPGNATGRINGIFVGYTVGNGWITAEDFLLENCYIHDFTQYGFWASNLDRGEVRNCYFKDNQENNVNGSATATNLVIHHSVFSGSASTSVAIAGTNNEVSNCQIRDGNVAGGGTCWGGEFMEPIRSRFLNNTITGFNEGIGQGTAGHDNNIENNIISNVLVHGINITGDSHSVIKNNTVNGFRDSGIILNGCDNMDVSENTVYNTTGYGTSALFIRNNGGTYAINNTIKNNILLNSNGLGIQFLTGCNNNTFLNNTIYGDNWGGAGGDLSGDNLVTGTIWKQNYGKKAASWLNESGNDNKGVTATVGGLTTGILSYGSQNITVTSSNAAYIVRLPASSASTIGTKITGFIGANGFKLGVESSQASSVYLNNVTTNKLAAIPANSYFEVICIDATHWILRAWTNLGAPITAIVPA